MTVYIHCKIEIINLKIIGYLYMVRFRSFSAIRIYNVINDKEMTVK